MEHIKNISPGVIKISFGTPEDITPEKLRSMAPLPCCKEWGEALPFPVESICCAIRPRGTTITLPLDKDEWIYGLGLSRKTFIQNGRIKALKAASSDFEGLGYSHAPVPLYASTKGYAVYVDTARCATFYVGTATKKRLRKNTEKNDLDNVKEENLYAGREAGNSMVVDIPTAQGIDLYLFYDADLKGAMNRYTLFSGGGALPPLWGLGPKYRSKASHTQGEVEALAGAIRKSEIPCTLIGLEPGWQTHAYASTYQWDKGRFPKPDAFIATLKENGFRVDLWQQAYVDGDSPLYTTLYPLSGDCEVWKGLVPDYTLDKTREAIKGYHGKALIGKGIASFKLDECDGDPPEGVNRHWMFPDTAAFPSGADGEQMRQLLGLLFQRTMHEAFRQSNTRTFGEVRATNGISAPYSFALYSDEYDLDGFVDYLASSAFAGVLWSPELRHADSYEEYARRLGVCTFSALFNMNAWQFQNPPWLQPDIEKNNRNELLEPAGPYEKITRKYTELRMALLPYLYNAYGQYHFEGIAPIRPLVMDHPKDPVAQGITDQWYFGDAIIVAPLLPRNTFCAMSQVDVSSYYGQDAEAEKTKDGYSFSAKPVKEGLGGLVCRFHAATPGQYQIRFFCKSSCGRAALRLFYIKQGKQKAREMIDALYVDNIGAPETTGGFFSREISIKKEGTYELLISRPWAAEGMEEIHIGVQSLEIACIDRKGQQYNRMVYLPKGNWFLFNSNKLYSQGWHMVWGGPDETPVFVKEGTLLPLARPVKTIGDDEVFALTVQLYGNCENKCCRLMEDDGVSFDYEQGIYNTVTIYADGTMERTGAYSQARYTIEKIERFSDKA